VGRIDKLIPKPIKAFCFVRNFFSASEPGPLHNRSLYVDGCIMRPGWWFRSIIRAAHRCCTGQMWMRSVASSLGWLARDAAAHRGFSDIAPDSPNEQTPYGNPEHNPIRASLEPDNSQRDKRSRAVFLTLDNHHLLSVTDQPLQSVGSPIQYRSPRFNAMSYGQTQRAPLYSPTEQVCVLHALLRPIPYLCQHRAVHYRPR
jgi:hypothetical protein